MKKIIIYVSYIIMSLLIIPITFADFQDWFMGCDFWNYGMWYGMWFWYIYLLIFLWVIIGLIVFTYKNINNNKNMWNNNTALDILKKRLASGEILEKEFDSLKNKLNEKNK